MTKIANMHGRQAHNARKRTAVFAMATLVLSAALIWPTLAAAQTPAGNSKSKGAGDRILTRDELRACFKQRDDLKVQRDALDRERSKLDAERADLVKEGATLKEVFDALDRTSQEAVDDYNAKAKLRDAGVDAWNVRNGAAKERDKAFEETHSGWRKNCNERRYREEDEAALRKGK
jgi:hypothetical protein